MRKTQFSKPHGTIVLAMSADGKISDVGRSPARFGSAADKAHLEKQIAMADGVLFGAGTLRAYGTTMPIANPKLLQQRESDGKPPQPVQILVSRSANIDSSLRFFQQPVPRWLLTTAAGAKHYHSDRYRPDVTNSTGSEFEKIIIAKMGNQGIDWVEAFRQLAQLELKRLAILGGGELVASLLAADVIDELCLTVCPLILGGAAAPTPVEGAGLLSAQHLQLLSVDTREQEVFLHYSIVRRSGNTLNSLS
ncbi:MAG: RibD family protein [Hormoscilla sp. GUM202]|nr:RibD family protein [Hormoscilla sp. GUM202]